MQWLILGAVGAALLYELLRDRGWRRSCPRSEEAIRRLPEAPGVYILHFPGLRGAVYIGSTKHLRTRLRQHKRQKPGWSTFDWYPTRTEREARAMEKRLLSELKRRRGMK